MAPKKGKKDPNAKRNRAATPIQCLVRKFLAKVKSLVLSDKIDTFRFLKMHLK